MESATSTGDTPVKILLVEDNAAHVALIRRSVQRAPRPMDLMVTRTLRETRAALAGGAVPDLAIIDLLLPDGRGTDLIGRDIDASRIPVVILTSHGTEQSAVDALKSGALDYVVKSESTLLDIPHVVERVLREWSLIEERRKALEALRESEQRYRTLLETASDAILVAEYPSGMIADANRQAQILFRRTLEELRGTCQYDLLEDPHRQAFRALVEGLEEGATPQPLELEVARPNGERVPVEAGCSLTSVRGRHLVHCVLRDVSERHRAAERLRQQEEALAHVTRVNTLGEMLAGIAHEINQPLYAITNLASAASNVLTQVQDNHLSPATLQSLLQWNAAILDAARRASHIIQRLRDFAAKRRLNIQPTDLEEIVKGAIQLSSHEFRRRQVPLRTSWSVPLPRVHADAIHIQQVLVNLLRNAVEAVSGHQVENPQVMLSIEPQAHEVQIRVLDNGPGFTKEIEDRLFEAFFSTKPTGMGMGLAISRSIIEAHQGKLWAENRPEGGAVFAFTLLKVH